MVLGGPRVWVLDLTAKVSQVLNSMEVPANKVDILKLFDKFNKEQHCLSTHNLRRVWAVHVLS